MVYTARSSRTWAARLCPRPFPCPASFLSWRVSFFLVLQFGFLPTTVWLLALGDLVRPRSWSFLYALSSWLASLASLILCLLNCNAPLGGVAQCWPGLARGLLLGDHYSGSGRLSIVEDDEEAPEMVDSASDGPSVPPDSARVAAPVLVPEVPTVAAHATRTPPALVATPDASLRGLRPLPQLLIWSGKRLMFPP
ncbi:hypothetical protein V6N12_057222 [Hibiscus sabdariffa]|uniref:Uncharacterized protein n=1 Tax=Hibiscus sabdariffa TaxID=183260 RepID=A0ABR2B7N9_9ROSI